jgi:HPt (histidine-containing phosphotransfer) domain-containing protein
MNRKSRTEGAREDAIVFDREHLRRYTMNSSELEREVLGLFLGQAPQIVAQLRSAASAAEWKLATHTLKGSAAAIGATEVNRLAARLERLSRSARNIATEIDQVEAAVARFGAAVGKILN